MSSVAEKTKLVDRGIQGKLARMGNAETHTLSAMSSVVRTTSVGFGCALMAAAIGVWVMPTHDPAVGLIKLGASVLMFGVGAIAVYYEKDVRASRRVEFDVSRRRLRTYRVDDLGHLCLDGEYELDSFAEVTLKNGVLFARDAAKGTVVSVPVNSRSQAAVIRRAMQLA